jgi:hypothetical protein
LGQLFLALEKRKDALDALSDALTEYSHALDIAPRHEPVRAARDRLAASLSELRANRE